MRGHLNFEEKNKKDGEKKHFFLLFKVLFEVAEAYWKDGKQTNSIDTLYGDNLEKNIPFEFQDYLRYLDSSRSKVRQRGQPEVRFDVNNKQLCT